MKYLETEHEKKSFVLASAIMAILLLLILFLGLSYMDPPPENGIAVNFGNTDFGSGNVNTTETVQTAPQPTESNPTTSPTTENVITQDDVDAAVIKETKKPNPIKEVKEVTPKKVETPKPSKSTTDALSSLLNGPKNDGKANDGDGTTTTAGNQGKLDGSIYANSYYGSGAGTGSGSGRWGLNGRRLTHPGAVKADCNDEGTIVVEVKVSKNGSVINAKFSPSGSNTTSKCLQEAAIKSAYKYKWNEDSNAPDSQVGFIVFNFRNGE
ncbi:energy transducer TonB [Flavobacterium sp.]|uniref:energy transducer TonB n=1 Tax=Flavobacterium sp. TaxID=239 RepID=UPI002FDA5968